MSMSGIVQDQLASTAEYLGTVKPYSRPRYAPAVVGLALFGRGSTVGAAADCLSAGLFGVPTNRRQVPFHQHTHHACGSLPSVGPFQAICWRAQIRHSRRLRANLSEPDPVSILAPSDPHGFCGTVVYRP